MLAGEKRKIRDGCAESVPRFSVEDKAQFETTELLKYLAERIDANKVPKKCAIIDKIPRTSNGKILRRELREDI